MTKEISFPPGDIIVTYVDKNTPALRGIQVKHIPTGITAVCRLYQSDTLNKNVAMKEVWDKVQALKKEKTVMGQPHKHAEVIKAWADGAEVQFRAMPEHNWQDIKKPTWVDEVEYRVKPEAPKSTLTDGELTALLGGEDVLVSAIQLKRARKVADAAVAKFVEEQELMYK